MRVRALPVIAAAAILVYGGALARFSHAGFPDRLAHGLRLPYISDKPLGEDAFYMITIGWNLGNGRGFTYGGEPTAGTQPLMTLAYGAMASVVRRAGGDRWTMARAALAFNVLLFVLFGDLVYRLARTIYPSVDDVSLCIVCAAIALFDYSLFRIFTYGLETGLYLIVAGVCVLASLHLSARPSRTGGLALGAAAGVAALTRLDFAVVFAFFVVTRVSRRRMPIVDAAIASATGAAITLPWLLFVRRVSGSWMPSSGQSQFGVISATDAGQRLFAALWALAHHLSPWFYPDLINGVLPRPAAAAMAALAVGLIVAAAVVLRARPSIDAAGTRDILATWLAAVAALGVVYVIAFWPQYFYSRYFALLALFALPHLAAGLTRVCVNRRGAVVCFSVLGIGFVATAAVTLHRGTTGDAQAITTHYIDANVDRAARVGAFSSGVSGYFLDNVVNLDGKVNARAMAARRAGTLPAYIDEAGIGVIADFPGTLGKFAPGPYLAARWRACPRPFPADAGVCLVRR